MLRVTKFLPRLAGQRTASLVSGKYSSIFENVSAKEKDNATSNVLKYDCVEEKKKKPIRIFI